MTSKFAILTVASVALLSCGAPTDGCGCEPHPPYRGYVVGFVTKGNSPVVDARVSALIWGTCQDPGYEQVQGRLGTQGDTAGHYRFELASRRADTICAQLVAYAGSDSIVRDPISVITGRDDSVRIDFAFP